MSDNRPIGILDSGFGGLTVLAAIQGLLPNEAIVYFGDNAFAPYGLRSPEEIRKRVGKIIEFLLSQESKLIVVACNTATVVGIEFFRKKFPKVPIVGLVPVVKTAAEKSKKGDFILLATSQTIESNYQKTLLRNFASHCQVSQIKADSLVELVEEGNIEEAENLVTDLLKERTGTELLVLGCTHFVFLKDFLTRKGWDVLDSGGAVVRV